MNKIDWHERAKSALYSVRNFIGGQYKSCVGEDRITKYSPRNGRVLYTFGAGDGVEVNEAVASAKAAFEDGRWRGLPVYQRKAVLQKLADLIEENKEEFALYECMDVGKPIIHALMGDIPRAAATLRGTAENADKLLSPSGDDGSSFVYQLRKPVGVVGGIIGWNFPLSLAITKMAPALAMGNSLVLKPSEFTSLSASRLAALAVEADVPPGVFNVIHGAGATVGASLAQHTDVNLLSFTGSSASGKQMLIASGQSNMKRLMLECGGKSPYLVFDDCPTDLDMIAGDVVARAFHNQGAVCVAGTRLLVQENIKDKLLPKLLKQVAQITPQDPLNPNTTFGALINEAHLKKVLAYIDSGEREGAKRIYGGKRIQITAKDIDQGGYYVEPTIFDNVNPQQIIAQEEIFGPVLSIITFRDEAEAIKIANGTCFGLAAYAATQNLGRAQRLGQRLNAGLVIIIGSSTPSGGGVALGVEGHRESGFGYEGGQAGLASYTVSTAVHTFF